MKKLKKNQKTLLWIVGIIIFFIAINNGSFLGATICTSSEPDNLDGFVTELMEFEKIIDMWDIPGTDQLQGVANYSDVPIDFGDEHLHIISSDLYNEVLLDVWGAVEDGTLVVIKGQNTYRQTITIPYGDNDISINRYMFYTNDGNFVVALYGTLFVNDYFDNFYTCTTVDNPTPGNTDSDNYVLYLVIGFFLMMMFFLII